MHYKMLFLILYIIGKSKPENLSSVQLLTFNQKKNLLTMSSRPLVLFIIIIIIIIIIIDIGPL